MFVLAPTPEGKVIKVAGGSPGEGGGGGGLFSLYRLKLQPASEKQNKTLTSVGRLPKKNSFKIDYCLHNI